MVNIAPIEYTVYLFTYVGLIISFIVIVKDIIKNTDNSNNG